MTMRVVTATRSVQELMRKPLGGYYSITRRTHSSQVTEPNPSAVASCAAPGEAGTLVGLRTFGCAGTPQSNALGIDQLKCIVVDYAGPPARPRRCDDDHEQAIKMSHEVEYSPPRGLAAVAACISQEQLVALRKLKR